ncbi:disease resistance protein RPM1-like [Humulus lupulus]|uniref:disease resistance protein RPM1-like n=1 Tax=Humulus lupulus TaxID=3486 RepID=UPI002B404A24|nr:disease resistance protein RPM1-like [Humulus lupulus]XP_062078202.1 disease resistance protein RPM1-like [Humulus lupulus]XP_062078203.1 disease resistance protein RPM1-like [Humulus lupulus]XP_062078204.1 disease resistance protein RPM1-like [Humulus lupulus]
MAEIAVGLVVDKLIPLLSEEAYLLRGIHNDVEGIKCDLDFLLAFLKDTDARVDTDQSNKSSHSIKVWVEKLRKIAFEVEDVIDEYTHLMVKQQLNHPHIQRFIGFFRKSACLVIKLKSRHDIASKVKDIRQRIRDINQTSASYDLHDNSSSASQSSKWYDPRKGSCLIEESDLVGIESSRDELITKVECGSPMRTVISLLGMGGLGKTTLANRVYVHTKDSFDCHAWIEVSQSYQRVELLQMLVKKFYESREESVPKGLDAMDEIILTTKLRDYLREKSYLVIFDDVWKTNFWGDIQDVLPNDGNDKNKRIVITTRYVEVANFCKVSSCVHIHNLQRLFPEKAWELFCKKAFRYELIVDCCPPHLDRLSHEIVERCQGLPLAIVVIAGLLSTKSKTTDEWRKLLTTLSSELQSNEHLESITKILSLSFNDLPYHLKSCFLYLGYFPEDYEIRCGRLVRQWIAEGFVKSKKDKTLEVIAKEYLVDLINRNLIQVSEVNFDGKARTCRIHDLLREIVLNKMEDLSFSQVLSTKVSNFNGSARRVSIINGSYEVIKNNAYAISQVRSIFIFDKGKILNHHIREIIINFKLLKVLDFEDAPSLDLLPKDIGNLFHLKYLSVRGTRVAFLPKSIGKLINLETLDLKQSLVFTIPVEIKRLQRLRYLLAYHANMNEFSSFNLVKGVQVHIGIGRLTTLQKLYFVDVNVTGFDLFKELSKLTELRKLGILNLRSEDGMKLCDCIQRMNHLESLHVSSVSEDDTIDLESISYPPQFLRCLHLQGPLKNLPKWIPELQNLTRISFFWSKLEIDHLNVLQNIPILSELQIFYDGYVGEKLHFKERTFPNLKVLMLYSLRKLQFMVIEEGSLCNLEELFIGPCPQLKELPSGFQHLTNIKKVHLRELPTIFWMSNTFQSYRNIGVDIQLLYRIRDELWSFRLEWVMQFVEYLRDHVSKEEWESQLDNYFSERAYNDD